MPLPPRKAWYSRKLIVGLASSAIIVLTFLFLHGKSSNTDQAAVDISAPSPSPLESLVKPLGASTAKLTVIEYADYQCPFCSKFQAQEMPLLKQDFIDTGKIRFEFRNAPLLGQESLTTAAAAYCANDQGKYWDYHAKLYAITAAKNASEGRPQIDKGLFSPDNLKHYASEIGLNDTSFATCLDSGKYTARVSAEVDAAASAGVQGTPMFIIGNQRFSGLQPYSVIKSVVESQL